MEWFRAYHGISSDSKWPLVARKAGQTVGAVVSVWIALLDHASQAKVRGSVADFDPEEIDALYGYDDGVTQTVIDAMSAKKLIVDGRLHAWGKRQPDREDSGSDTAMSSTERTRKWRERKRAEVSSGNEGRHDATRCDVTGRDGTQRDATGRNGTTRKEQRRTEREQRRKHPPIPPPGGGGAG